MAKSKPIEVGDVVRLKSGSPSMTVTGFNQKTKGWFRLVEDRDHVCCEWFNNETHKFQVGWFDTVSLERTDAEW